MNHPKLVHMHHAHLAISVLGMDRDPLLALVKQGGWTFKEKTSYAARHIPPNASEGSKSAYCPTGTLWQFDLRQGPYCDIGPSYTMAALTDNTDLHDHDHNGIVIGVREWLTKKLRGCAVEKKLGVNVKVAPTDVSLGIMSGDFLFRKVKKPDISIWNGDFISVQFEVESNENRDHTITKLGFGLIDQLKYLMNCDVTNDDGDEVLEVSGFYIPVKEGYVERVVLSWNDVDLQWILKCYSLKQEGVFDTITEVCKTQIFPSLEQDKEHKKLTIPLSKKYISKEWKDDPDAYQAISGNSVVIICPTQQSVYKLPVGGSDIDKLLTLHRNEMHKVLQHAAAPTGIKEVKGRNYFVFKMYHPPLTKEKAKKVIVPFIDQVVEAIHEMHSFEIAHLDIRLDNICLNDNGQVVFIDLDRSRHVDKPDERCQFGASTMYVVPMEWKWKARNLDWRQLAIMIYFITCSKVLDYHKIEVKEDSHEFLQELYYKGCYNKHLHEDWKKNWKKYI